MILWDRLLNCQLLNVPHRGSQLMFQKCSSWTNIGIVSYPTFTEAPSKIVRVWKNAKASKIMWPKTRAFNTLLNPHTASTKRWTWAFNGLKKLRSTLCSVDYVRHRRPMTPTILVNRYIGVLYQLRAVKGHVQKNLKAIEAQAQSFLNELYSPAVEYITFNSCSTTKMEVAVEKIPNQVWSVPLTIRFRASLPRYRTRGSYD